MISALSLQASPPSLPCPSRLQRRGPRRAALALLLAGPLLAAAQQPAGTACLCMEFDDDGLAALPADEARPLRMTAATAVLDAPLRLQLSETLTVLGRWDRDCGDEDGSTADPGCPETAPRAAATASAPSAGGAAGASTALDAARRTSNGTPAAVGAPHPAIAVNAQHFDFGRIEVGVSSLDRTLVITSRTGLLKIRSISVTGDYAGHHNCPRWLDVGKSCQITGRFKPTDIGERHGRVTILTNVSAAPMEISLSGTGF